ncbi:MAG: DMT family transporter [Verrucomicrobiae bacterium]|nr:DMT family transporter [Verrucomicrobiae bacterium]
MDPTVIGAGAALLSAASWAVGSILFKRIGERVSPFGMTLSKGVVSLVLLGTAVLFAGFGSLSAKELLLLCLSGVIGIAVADTLFFAALQDLGPKVLIVYFMMGQILTAFLAFIFLGETLSMEAIGAIVITLSGIALVLWTKIRAEEAAQARTGMRGILLGLLCMLAMSSSMIIAKPALKSASALVETFIRMAAGTAGMFLFGAATRRLGDWLEPLKDTRLLLFFIGSVCVVTFGGFWLSLVAVKYIKVATASTLGATEPLFVLPLAAFFLKERIYPLDIVGTLLAVAGIVLLCRNLT